MTFDPKTHHRRSIRLEGYDYTQRGAYFVTLCIYQRACLLGDVVNGDMRLSAFGDFVREQWLRSAVVRANVELDEFVVMPNHLHGIIVLTHQRATHRVAPTPIVAGARVGGVLSDVGATRWVAPARRAARRLRGPAPGSLGAILEQFKSITTKGINKQRGMPGDPVWQGNYFEHVIRNDIELKRIRQYIIDNPSQWALDRENPARTADQAGTADAARRGDPVGRPVADHDEQPEPWQV